MKDNFCTCGDHECPFNPINHDKGCTPCIEKNRQEGEIPSCFFNIVSPDKKPENYFFEDFAKMVLAFKNR